MAQDSILQLKIENFRAIKKADIELNGITVAVGENGAGKSTISKLLYYSIKIVNYYDEVIYEKLKDRIYEIIKVLSSINRYYDNDDLKNDLDSVRNNDAVNKKELLIDIIDRLQEYDDKQLGRKIDKIRYRLLLNFIIRNDVEDFDNIKDSKDVWNILKKKVVQLYDNAQKDIQARSKKIFENKLASVFNQKLKDFVVCEHGEAIISRDDQLGQFFSISNAIYIDSPMAVEHPAYKGRWGYRDIDTDAFSHWKDLNFYLKETNQKHLEEIRDTDIYGELQDIFSSDEILDGKISINEGREELIYRRNDGQNFPILDCATGVKSIAILQMLYINGWLSNKTLLILDEPETHLHPQWIVEYARLVVWLNKKVGVTFFIASHNPDMVSAIQDISDKQGINDNLKFYLAKKQEDYTYKFNDQGTDEENIFASFNIAINKINKYGGDDE